MSSTSLLTNVVLLKLAYKEVEGWLKNAGLAPDLSKREIMQYSRRPKYDCNPHIVLNDYNGVTRTLTPDRYVKWLGVHFDRKLNFHHHVKISASKGTITVNGLLMLANTVRGLSHALLRRLYLSCIIPKVLYACPAWWNNTKCQANPLEKVQRKALITICAAFKTTPTHALEVEASIPPLKHHTYLMARRYTIRLNKLPISNPIIQRLPVEWRNNNRPSFPLPIPTEVPKSKPKYTLQKLSRHTSHNHERINPFAEPPWSRPITSHQDRVTVKPCDNTIEPIIARENHINLVNSLKTNPNTLCLYTDGSRLGNPVFPRIGAGVVAYQLGKEIGHTKIGMGSHTEVFDAEMAALSKASTMAAVFIEDFPNTSKLLIFSDNTSAVQAIVNPKPSSAQLFALSFIKNVNTLLDSHPLLSISLEWCPSHCDIPGNERADSLAKEATSLRCQIPFTTSRSNARRRSKTTTTKLWHNEWKISNNSGRFAIANRLKPSLNPSKHFVKLKDNRKVFGRVLQCRTGHAYLGEFCH